MTSQELIIIKEFFQPAFRHLKPQDPVPDSVNTSADRFIFCSPHSGRIYPPAFLEKSNLTPLQLRSSEDAYVDELFAHTVDQGAHFIHALVPRAYLDLNRQPFELDPRLLTSPPPDYATTDTTKVKSGLGVIARIVSEGRSIYKNRIHLTDALERIDHLYFPYHRALDEAIETTLAKRQQAIVIDCHSMPSGNLPGFALVPPDFVLGNQFDKSCHYELTHLMRSELQAMGYVVSVNKPYAGGYVTGEYGNPRSGVHVLQMEINRRLYLDEHSLEKTAGFETLRNNMMKLSARVIKALPDLSPGSRLAAE